MKINKNIVHLIILITFIYSKFFYLSIIAFGDLNFTLSDLCMGIMLYFIMTSKLMIPSIYKNILFLSLLMLLIFSLGSLLQSTSITNGLIMFIKRWLSLLILPIYISRKFKKENIPVIIYSLILIVVCFILLNLDQLLKSLESTRFSETFNPNILGMVMSMILIFLITYKVNNISKFAKYITYVFCWIVIIAVSSRGALLALIPTITLHSLLRMGKITLKRILTFMLVIILLFIIINTDILKTIFPYSYTRIFGTLEVGIVNDMSAASRIDTQFTILRLITQNIGLLLFGTGFGNSNMYLGFLGYGYSYNTSDSMYVNLIAWSGIIGTLFFVGIILLLLKSIFAYKGNPMQKTLIFITMFVFLGGISADTITEPTIGGIYFVFLGIFEIYNLESERKSTQNEGNMHF